MCRKDCKASILIIFFFQIYVHFAASQNLLFLRNMDIKILIVFLLIIIIYCGQRVVKIVVGIIVIYRHLSSSSKLEEEEEADGCCVPLITQPHTQRLKKKENKRNTHAHFLFFCFCFCFCFYVLPPTVSLTTISLLLVLPCEGAAMNPSSCSSPIADRKRPNNLDCWCTL